MMDVEKIREGMRAALEKHGQKRVAAGVGIHRQSIYNFTREGSQVYPKSRVLHTYLNWLQENGFMADSRIETHAEPQDALSVAISEMRRTIDMMEDETLPRDYRLERFVSFVKSIHNALETELFKNRPSQ